MPGPLDDRTAIVTGGTTGIGKATARALLEQGANVTIASRSEKHGEQAVDSLEDAGEVAFVATNVRDEEDIAALVDGVAEEHGSVDVLVNAAGTEGLGQAELDAWTADTVQEILEVNVTGSFLALQKAVETMGPDGGTVVNIGSFVGTVVPVPPSPIYGASKAGVVSLTRAVAADLAEDGVRVLAVCPWTTDTPMVDRLTGGDQGAKHELASEMNPSGELVQPEDVAGVIADIVTGKAPFETGDAVLVDAGGETSRLTTEVEPIS